MLVVLWAMLFPSSCSPSINSEKQKCIFSKIQMLHQFLLFYADHKKLEVEGIIQNYSYEDPQPVKGKAVPSTSSVCRFFPFYYTVPQYIHTAISFYLCVHVHYMLCTFIPWPLLQEFYAMTKSSYSSLACLPPFTHYKSAASYLTYFFHPAPIRL